MDVTITPLSEVEQEAEITLSVEDLQPQFEEAYKKFRPKVELKGFRKGKVPIEMVKKMYGEAIEQDFLDTIASDTFRTVMEDRKIQPIGKPALVDMDYKRKEQFRFKIKYEVKPPIELKQYKGLAVEKPVHTVTQEEMDAEVHRVRRANSTTHEVEKVTDNEHIITADVQELDESGTPLIGKKSANAQFYLADETLAEQIKKTLANAETGKEYRSQFESQHGDHTHTMNLSIAVKKIEKIDLPQVDEEFVKKITREKVSTVDEFMTGLRQDLERYWENESERRLSDALASEVVRLHEFPVPESLVNSFLDAFVEDVKGRSKDRSLPKGFDEAKFREESRSYAVWQAKWMLVKERIIEAENLTISDNELEQLAEAESSSIGIDKDRLLQYYKSSGGAAERLLSSKIMGLLKSSALITEKEMTAAGD